MRSVPTSDPLPVQGTGLHRSVLRSRRRVRALGAVPWMSRPEGVGAARPPRATRRALRARSRRAAPARGQSAKRSIVEYYFTCTPAWIWHVLGRRAEAHRGLSRRRPLILRGPAPLLGRRPQLVSIIGHRSPGVATPGVVRLTTSAGSPSRRCNARDAVDGGATVASNGARPAGGREVRRSKYLDDWPTRFRGLHVGA